MKKLISSINVELKKTIFSYGFILCVIVTFLLCFTSSVYIDSFTGKEYSTIEIMAEKNKFKMLSFTSTQILYSSISPYLTLFLPVLSSIPFVSVFCAERIGGSMRFTITRSGKNVYCISKFISALISGGLAVMLGFIFYSIVIYFEFPDNNAALSEFMKMYAGMCLYGMVSVLPAFFLSSFIKNKYIICCFPFIFMHFYYTTISKIQDILNVHEKYDIVAKIIFLYPNELKNIFITGNTDVVIYNFVLSAAAIISFTIIMNRRLDYGQ